MLAFSEPHAPAAFLFLFLFLSQLLPAADLEARVLAPLVRARAEALDDLCSKVHVR